MAAPTYPLSFPTTIGVSKSEFGLQRAVGFSQSPFTGSQQVFEHSMALWNAVINLPPMSRSQVAEYQTFFMQLHGRKGTFTMGDPDAKTPLGNASQTNLNVGSGASIGALDVIVTGLTGNQQQALKKGDYIQFGSGADAKLHMVIADADANVGGQATVQIEPALKVAVTTSTTVTIRNTVGVWRMNTNELNWNSDNVSKYGFSFSCQEAF